MTMSAQIVVLVGTLLCSLVAGFLFAFAVVVMPGLARLSDREFTRGFQTIDGVIQRGQPLFGVQLPTFLRNVPLNNELQAFDAQGSDDAACRSARERFETSWDRWNRWRTVVAVLVTAALLTLLAQT